MYCSQDLDIIKQKTNEVEQKLTHFKSQIRKMHTVCHHVLSAIRGYQCMCFVGATLSSQL
ncbi:hypothetical protein AB205_0019120 [Aquarana catesbeiana]|uniref:Uncharacterized protein n=1 Tax=Aquarana catesbeiana TaxID=8400 RepID=A0A2G9Q7H7_AQUCT|nr:hypothetical protein AB205_0019120 [Aquarana catesbeiana]